MDQNQTGQNQSTLQSPTMFGWRLHRAEVERRESQINREILDRQHEG